MRKLSLLVVIVLVLSLLVAVGTPVSAGKPKPPGEKVKNVPKGQSSEKKPDTTTPPGQTKPKKQESAGSVVAPADTPEPGENASQTVVVCHKPGTPAEQTLVLPQSALSGHLRHGDTEGPCLTQSPNLTPTVPITLTVVPVTPTLPLSSTAKISICHKPGTPAEQMLWLPASAVPGHLGHGDVRGPCQGATSPPTSTIPSTGTLPVTSTVPVTTVVVPTNTVRILICHKPGTAAEQTLALPAAEVPEHLAHLDTLGACEGAPSITWATDLIVALTQWLMRLFT